MLSSCGGHSEKKKNRNYRNAEISHLTALYKNELNWYFLLSLIAMLDLFFDSSLRHAIYLLLSWVVSAGINCVTTQLQSMPALNDLKNKFKGSIPRIVHLTHQTNEAFNLLVVFYLSRRRKHSWPNIYHLNLVWFSLEQTLSEMYFFILNLPSNLMSLATDENILDC